MKFLKESGEPTANLTSKLARSKILLGFLQQSRCITLRFQIGNLNYYAMRLRVVIVRTAP